MHIPNGNIYISLWEDALELYEEDALKKMDIQDTNFLVVDYSNKNAPRPVEKEFRFLE